MTKRSALPVFAIVTPSFNQAEFVEQTIESVLNQRGRGELFEIRYAVIDGGSRDSSINVLRNYSDQLAYWCSEGDRGQSHAINKGFAQVRGDYHAYINSDDFYLPDAFARVVQAGEEFPDADLIHGICRKVDSNGRTVGQQVSSIRSQGDLLDLWNYWLRPKHNQNFIQPEVFWTRSLHERVGAFDESLCYTMDFDFWLRAFAEPLQMATIDQPLAAFRLHAAQKTTDRDASILELVDGIQPYLQPGRASISERQRKTLLLYSEFTRSVIESNAHRPTRRIKSLLSMAADHPRLLRSRHFWRHLRRSGKQALGNRRAA